MNAEEVSVGNGNGGAVFIKVTNKDIYDKLIDLDAKVQKLNIKVYGVIGGFVAAGAYLITTGGLGG